VLCHPFARLLPPAWQSFAMPMARPCHAEGKALPSRWQKNTFPILFFFFVFFSGSNRDNNGSATGNDASATIIIWGYLLHFSLQINKIRIE